MKYFILLSTLFYMMYKVFSLPRLLRCKSNLELQYIESKYKLDESLSDSEYDGYGCIGCLMTFVYFVIAIYYLICGFWVYNSFFLIFCALQAGITIREMLQSYSLIRVKQYPKIPSIVYRLVFVLGFDIIHFIVIGYTLYQRW